MMLSRLSRARQVQAVQTHDVVVIGSGVGGLTVAIETPDLQVGLLTKTCLGLGGSSPMAQGGVAAAIGAGDSPAAHAADTPAASDGLARALWEMRQQGHRTLLDARAVIGTGDAVAFPTALRHGLEHGFDLRHEPVPVSPAAHYHLTVAGAVAHAAASRRGSCGAHFRSDDLGAPGVRHQVSGRPCEHRPS